MKKSVLCLFTFIFVLLLIPVNVKATTNWFTYGVSGVKVTDEKIAIAGWAYYTFINFCNSDNSTYANYEMVNSDGASAGIANKCSGKGYNSVKYRLFAKPKNGNKKKVYAKSKSGSIDNLRTTGISATCVNYYKSTASDGESSIHCDGETAPFGEFPSAPINYSKRNYNVQNNVSGFKEGAFFYDDIGFIGEFDLKELEEKEEYTVFLEIEFNDGSVKFSFPISVPGVVLVASGFKLSEGKGDKITVSKSFHDYLIGYSPSVGTINQDAGSVYYDSGDNKFKQYTPKLGGGYFEPEKKYKIKAIKNFSNILVTGNKERLGGFDLYSLGTTGTFNDKYTTPGTDYKYHALATWLSYKGEFSIRKTSNKCGGTLQYSDDRKKYCNNPYNKPSDYDMCCDDEILICGGTALNTSQRVQYCALNPNDATCCKTQGECPVTSTYTLNQVAPTSYTYWKSASTDDDIKRVAGTDIKNNTKYCTGMDSTTTMFADDSMVQQYNNAFCYQKGSFNISSPNKTVFTDYILTYSGGAYSLNVDYDTELVCVSLDTRKVTRVEYYDEECKFKKENLWDDDIYFSDQDNPFDDDKTIAEEYDCSTIPNTCPSGATGCPAMIPNPTGNGTCAAESTYIIDKVAMDHFLHYNRSGKFSIGDDIKDKFEEVPDLYLIDTTDNVEVKFDVAPTITEEGRKNISIDDIKRENPDFFDSLGGSTTNEFVQKIRLRKKIKLKKNTYTLASMTSNGENIEAYNQFKYDCKNSSTWRDETIAKRISEKKISSTYIWDKNNYYGTLGLVFDAKPEENVEHCNGNNCTYTCKYKYWYEGEVTKTMYVTIEDTYKVEAINLNVKYTLDSIPDKIKERFGATGEKYVSQFNLSDYYQITLGSREYNSSGGKYFGVAKNWNMGEVLCALDLTDHDCDPTVNTCACKYDKNRNPEKGVYYSDCLDFRVVSVNSLFPGKEISSLCVNPTSNCRQPGRNWLYVSNEFKKVDNFNFIVDGQPMYHITLTPSTMNDITNNKDYYTNIDLGIVYNPGKCTYAGDSKCSSDYESTMLDGLGNGVFTRNRAIINTRYRALKNMFGGNFYKDSKNDVEAGD